MEIAIRKPRATDSAQSRWHGFTIGSTPTGQNRSKRVQRLVHHSVVPVLCPIALAGCVMPPVTTPSRPPASSASKEPMVTVAPGPSIEVGDVTAVYVTTTFPSPYPPITGLDWVNPWANSNHITLLQLKAPNAISQSGNLVQPLDLDDAIAKAGDEDKLVAALDHLPSTGAEVSKSIAAGLLLPPLIFFAPAYPPLLLAPVLGPVAAVSGVMNRHRLQLDDASFAEQPIGQINEKGATFKSSD